MDQDPVRRVLLATAVAVRGRQKLPARDPRRSGSMWLRPGWPDDFLLRVHRGRLVQALADDEALRTEVGDLLQREAPPRDGEVAPHPDRERFLSEAEAAAFVAAEVADEARSADTLAAAALDQDPLVVAAARPYLMGERSLPRPVRPAAKTTADVPPRADLELRQQVREMRSRERELRRELNAEKKEAASIREQLTEASDAADRARAEVAALRAQLPSPQERAALAAAATHQDKVNGLQRELGKERASRVKEMRSLRALAQEAEDALARTQADLDAERRGRRKLEAELGDASVRARRLEPLIRREVADLRKTAADMRDGRDKTRKLKRANDLERLGQLLSDLYGLDTAESPSAQTLGEDGGGTQKARTALTAQRGLRVTALGGANHIGGSALLVEAGGTRLLVDAGLKPQAHLANPGPDRVDEAVRERLHAVVVTHAHADHAGFVPWVVGKQPRTQVLCSPETKALLPTVWADSVRVMRAEADAASSWTGHREPPYSDAEVSQAEEALRSFGYGQTITVGDLELTLFRAGHILGAAGVVIRAGQQRVVITGDIDNRGQASVGPAQLPRRLAAEADLLVIETTYCDSIHGDRAHESNNLVRQTEEVLAVGGRVLIPAFGLGRAQEIALLLGEQLPNVDVLVDGLARDISDLYALNGAPEVLHGRVRKVRDRDRDIMGFHGGVVITTSGMLTGGAAIPWARAVLSEPDSALFLCGHQDEEAPGRELERLAEAEPDTPRRVLLRDDKDHPVEIDVAAMVHRYNLSAHADRTGLTEIVNTIRPRAVMLVHGEPGPQAVFRERLGVAGYHVVDNRESWDADAAVPDSLYARRRHASQRSRRNSGYRGQHR